MGTGNKLDPTRFEITDISKTSVCPLARVMRYELKKRKISKVTVVYSKEEPHHKFNEEDKKYKDIAMNALEEVAKQDKIFELNTGAISRGWKTSPYPAPFLLKRLSRKHLKNKEVTKK